MSLCLTIRFEPQFGRSVNVQETSRLLELWRQAERAAAAAHLVLEHAKEAAEASARAAEVAKLAVEEAGIIVDEADASAMGARDAYHEREADVDAEAATKRFKGAPGGLGETT